MHEMTSKERLTAALRGETVDRIPWSPFLAYIWETFPTAVQQAGQLAFYHAVGADPLWRGAPCPVRGDVHGVEYRSHEAGPLVTTEAITPVGTLTWTQQRSTEGNTQFLREHPLKTVEDCKIQCWIEEHTTFTRDLTEVEAHLQGEGHAGLSLGILMPRFKTAFQQLIEFSIGTEEMAYLLADTPEAVMELLEVMVHNDLQAAAMAVDAPYDFFLTYEDSSTQNYSPAQYAANIQPEITALCGLLASAGKRFVQHACGHVRALLPLLLESGVAVVESLSPPPTGNITLRDARAMLGQRMGIIGGIEPTALLHTPLAEFPAYVEQVIADGHGGPFVLANSDSCPPGVPIEKFRMVGEIVRRMS
jgi:hypothetical protein